MIIVVCLTLFLESYLFRHGFLRGYRLGFQGKLRYSVGHPSPRTESKENTISRSQQNQEGTSAAGYSATTASSPIVSPEGSQNNAKPDKIQKSETSEVEEDDDTGPQRVDSDSSEAESDSSKM
jgi:hypothetical protein